MHFFPIVVSVAALCHLAASKSIPRPSQQQPISPDEISAQDTIRDILITSSIIDDVLDDFTPTYSLAVSYAEDHESVELGNDIPVASLDSRPTFEFHPLDPVEKPSKKNLTYTLILTDPDAKSRQNPKWSEMCHWIVTNLTAPALLTLKASKENVLKSGELMEYQPPGPPPKTGKHRYVFVLLAGNSTSLTAPKDRQHWGYGKVRHGVRDWAAENELTVLGANFFYAANKKQ